MIEGLNDRKNVINFSKSAYNYRRINNKKFLRDIDNESLCQIWVFTFSSSIVLEFTLFDFVFKYSNSIKMPINLGKIIAKINTICVILKHVFTNRITGELSNAESGMSRRIHSFENVKIIHSNQ